jgi:hypothetical protein
MRAELGKVAGAGGGTPERHGLTVTQALPVEIAVGCTRAIENDGDTSGELSKRRYAPRIRGGPAPEWLWAKPRGQQCASNDPRLR